MKNKPFQNINELTIIILVIFITLLIVAFPSVSLDAALKGLNLWFNIVLPSLLPFFIANEMLIGLGIVRFFGVLSEPLMRKIFNLPGEGSFAVIMGFLCGYPTGAKITKDLYEKDIFTKNQAERLLAFTNNSGPLFIIGAVAVGMFHNPELGIILLLAHWAAAITVGITFRFFNSRTVQTQSTFSEDILSKAYKTMIQSKRSDGRSFGTMLGDSIKNSMNLIIAIGGFIIFFSVIISLLTKINIISGISSILAVFLQPLGIDASLINSIFCGVFEMTNGINLASNSSSIYLYKVLAASFMLGFAGFSIHFQVISIISNTNLNYIPYLIGKFIQGILASIYTYVLFKFMILTPTHPVFYNLSLEHYTFNNYLIFSLILLSIIICLMTAILFIAYMQKKIRDI